MENTYGSSPDFSDNPDLILTDEYSIKSAMWHFNTYTLNKLNINSASVREVTLRTNGGTNGLKHRIQIYNRANKIFNNE